MANVPRTLPALVISGCDQEARRPWRTASSRYSSGHLGSVVTSAMMTRSLRNAAVPQAPRSGPIVQGLMAGLSAAGNAGPPPGHRRFPSGSISRTVDTTPGVSRSMVRHSSSSTSWRPTPPAIIPIARFSAADSAFARTSDIAHGRMLGADAAECGIVVAPARLRVGAENVHVVCLDEIVAGLLDAERRVEMAVRAQQSDAFAAERDPWTLEAGGLRHRVNQALKALAETTRVGCAVHHDSLERLGGIEQDAAPALDGRVDLSSCFSQRPDDTIAVGPGGQHDGGMAG